jgi:serine/threonine protein kinase
MAAGFILKRRLGAGQFGEVWLAFDSALAIDRAVKLVPPSKVQSEERFFEEAQVLKSVTHDNIVCVEDAGRMEDGRLYIAMEYLPKGSVEDEARGAPMAMTRAMRLTCDALRALERVHELGVLHRDIKAANILVGNCLEGKLSDFGLATRTEAEGVASPQGYLYQAAPEIVRGDAASQQTDVYAAGVTLYRLVNGDDHLPSLGTAAAYASAISDGEFPDRKRYRLYVPRSLKLVINKAMHPDPTRRYLSAKAFRNALGQVRIKCDWHEEPTATGTRWIGACEGLTLMVEMTLALQGRVNVSTSKRRQGRTWRNVSEGSRNGMRMAEGRRFAARILSKCASEGRLASGPAQSPGRVRQRSAQASPRPSRPEGRRST